MRILYVTTVSMTMGFFPEHFKMLIREGHTVELACNSDNPVPESVAVLGLKVHNIPFSRSPFTKDNLVAVKKLKELLDIGNYDIVHTHTPNASAIVRLVCRKLRKQGLKVFYTAHGFHFYKGAPLKNWLIYYPIEWVCSRWTDTLITINQEDYELAQKHMHAIKTFVLPGIGVDLERFFLTSVDKNKIRREFGISSKDKVLVYVAEINQNKNQLSLVDVLNDLSADRSDVKLMLIGAGCYIDKVAKKAEILGIGERLIMTGRRTDVPELLKVADIAVPVSIREGFGLNVIEAMACGIPVVAYDNRGHRTIIRNGENGYIVPFNDHQAMAQKVESLLDDEDMRSRIINGALGCLGQYSVEHVVNIMQNIYQQL